MTTRRRFLVGLGAAGVTASTAPRSAAGVAVQDRVEVKPRELDEVLVNPGIGFETGGCFNGGRKVRNYPVCSIAYFRFYWDRLEPEEGRYAFDLIEQLLTKARERGQDLALRFMPMDTDPKTPAWFRAKEKGFTYQVKAAGWERGLKKGQMVETWAPDFNSPFFLERQEALVRAFGESFNGHPDLVRMDIGSIGRWGEWHTSGTSVPMPTEENALRVIDWYFQYWGRTPLTMLVGYTPGLRHAVRRGAGWRADSLGDWGHFSDRWYPRTANRGGPLELRMRWENVGVAPPYRPYVLAARLQQGERSFVLDTDAELTKWLPGQHDVEVCLPLRNELAAGDYELAIGILDPHYRQPEVRLAIAGRQADGWYAMGRLGVT